MHCVIRTPARCHNGLSDRFAADLIGSANRIGLLRARRSDCQTMTVTGPVVVGV